MPTEVRRNLCLNPSGEAAAGWTANNTAVHLMSDDTSVFYHGTKSKKSTPLPPSPTIRQLATFNNNVPGTTDTTSITITNTPNPGDVVILFQRAFESSNSFVSVAGLGGTWNRIVAPWIQGAVVSEWWICSDAVSSGALTLTRSAVKNVNYRVWHISGMSGAVPTITQLRSPSSNTSQAGTAVNAQLGQIVLQTLCSGATSGMTAPNPSVPAAGWVVGTINADAIRGSCVEASRIPTETVPTSHNATVTVGAANFQTIENLVIGNTSGANHNSLSSAFNIGGANAVAAVGKQHIGSLYVRHNCAVNANAYARMQYLDAGSTLIGSTQDGSVVSVPPNIWTRIYVVHPLVAPSNAAFVRLTEVITRASGNCAPGEAVWLDAAMLESNTNLGDYFDGSFGVVGPITYAWTGTANASASTATQADITGSRNDQIFAALVAGGYAPGSVVDMERKRLLAALALTEPQKYSLYDLYRLKGETPRLVAFRK